LAQQRFDEAAQAYRESLAYDPSNLVAWNNLGSAEHVQNHLEAAHQAYESSLALSPHQHETRLKLALVLEKQWKPHRARHVLREIIQDEPGHAAAWDLLGRNELLVGEHRQAVEAFQQSLLLKPNPDTHSRLLHSMQYQEGATPTQLRDAHCAWDQRYAIAFPKLVPTHQGTRDTRLRLGFMSAQFGVGPIGFLALPLFEKLDKSQCSITCYFDSRVEDEMTPRFRNAADRWRVIHGQSDESVALQIVEDGIDVLVDLMGHTGNRLLVFARKPAPMQVTWLGYVGTTGLSAMDFLLADRFHVQPGEENSYAESILRMPAGYACYGPPTTELQSGPLPAASSERVVFACFNNPAKYTKAVLMAWAEILLQLPSAALLLKYGGLDEPERQTHLRSIFSANGVDPNRVLLEGWSPYHELVRSYSRVDIALDTQPYSGGLTTCEALWMGVPVITVPGATFAGRHATSYLQNSGYPQWIANDLDGYIKLAVEWAGRLEELAVLRSRMREQVRNSPICDAAQFAVDFLQVLRDGWGR